MRLEWGGGDARHWQGSLSVADGTLSNPQALALEADEPGAIRLEAGVLQIESPSERSYAGVDITLQGAPEAEVTVQLRGKEMRDGGYQLRMPLEQFVTQVQAGRLDERGNRLVVRRAPGDRLRIDLQRDHLVFSPGEMLAFQLKPHLTQLSANASYTLRLRLSPARQSAELWSQQHRLSADAHGNLPPLEATQLTLPSEEGVYDLVVSVHPWQITSAIRRTKPALERKLQLVVISPQAPSAPSARWDAAAFEIDPANPTWWDRLPRWSLTNIWPSFAQGPITSGAAGRRRHLDRTWIELPTEAWQAYPLGIGELGKPHLLEIEYPSNVPQRLGISIIEPNAAGRVAPQGVDSGVVVGEESTLVEGSVTKHRLIFWPRTSSPLVLLTNRSEEQPALFGKIRVLSGPQGLPPANLGIAGEAAGSGGRLLAAYLEKPLFAENFATSEALDEENGRSLQDWLTFYQGGRRLIEYLKHMGYNGAMLAASCEGSSLYPSELLHPTPMYNNGTFFSSGQDPVRKDVLEMLFRMFDREGLTLIPAMQWATPLPALEAQRRTGMSQLSGLEWIDPRGRTLVQGRGTEQGLAPYYNPLQGKVQQAMLEVVEELNDRYSSHDAYGGIAIQLGPHSFARLPGERFGFDDATLTRFAAETGLAVQATGPDRFAVRAQVLLGPHRKEWLDWRADTMTRFYGQLAAAVAAGNPQAKLYLADANLIADPTLQQALRPGLPRKKRIDEALLEQGLNLPALHKNPHLVVMRTRRHPSAGTVAQNAANLEMNEADDIRRFYETLGTTAGLHYQPPEVLRLPEFDKASPFGAQNTFTRLVSQLSPSGAERRRALVKNLAEADRLLLAEGGWMLPLGQEDAIGQLLATYRALPAMPFETVVPDAGAAAGDGGLIVRSLREGDRTWLYLLNNTPWPVTAELELAIPATTPLQAVAGRSIPALQQATGGNSQWTVPLAPYDLLAATFTTDKVQVVSSRAVADASIRAELRKLAAETLSRIKVLQQSRPIASMENTGFEAPPAGADSLPAWVCSPANAAAQLVEPDGTRPHSGGRALRMENRGNPAWLRSEPLAPPETGRIAILVWLRTTDADSQPRVHLSLDYDHAGEHRYESKVAGAGSPHPLRTVWTPYVANFDDLPTQGVSDLRVGVDVMTPGTIWLDDFQAFDSRFEPTERDQLMKIWALANFYLEQDRLGDCYQVLQGYWPRFLRDTISLPAEVAALPPEAPPQVPAAQQPEVEEAPGFLDRVKSYAPTRWLPFR